MKYVKIDNNEKLRKNISLLIFSALAAALYMLFSVSIVSAAPPDATNRMPNNPSGADEPWLVLTTPGSNGMDAPTATVGIYSTVSSAPIYIENACDTSSQDDSGANNTTNFSIPKSRVSSVTNVVGANDMTIPLQNLIRVIYNDPTYIIDQWFFQCNGSAGNDMSMTLNFNSSAIVRIGDTDYYSTVFVGILSDRDTSSYYVNRYKLRSSNSGVNFSYAASSSSTGPGTVNALYTGIAFSDASSGWGWSTQLAFAEPCRTTTNGISRKVWFYDTDNNSSTSSAPTSPYWQSNGAAYRMNYSIQRYNRNTGASIGSPITGNLTGGQNTADETNAFDTYPNEKYIITVSGINYVNSIQIALPLEQINANEPCPVPTPAACSVGVGNIVAAPGSNFSVPLTFNAGSFGAGSAGGGLHIGIAEQGNPSSWNRDSGFTIPPDLSVPPPDKQTTFVPQTGGLSNATAYNTTWSDGFNYKRYYVNNPSSGATVTIKAPSTNGTRTLVVRLLDRANGKWLSDYCTVTVDTSSGPGLITCPSYPPYLSFTDPNVVVPLPNAGKTNNQSVPATPSNSWSGSVIQDTRSTSTTLTAIRQVLDTSTGNSVLTYGYSTVQPITQVQNVLDQWGQAPNWNPAYAGDGTVELDYTPFLSYPYDLHNPVVTYKSSVFTRNNLYTYTRTRTYNYTRATTTSPWVLASSGNNGWSPSRASYTDSSPYWGNNVTATGKEMPPCFPREYIANPIGTSANFSVGGRESPTQSSFTFTIPTTLNFNYGGNLRTATIVNGISYTVNWAAEGYSSPNISGSFSRTTNISNTSTSNGAIGTASVSTEYTSTFSIPTDIRAGDRICWTVTVGQSTGTVKTGGTIWNPAGPSVTSPKTCTVLAVDQPYTRFYGGDVFAGGGFTTPDGTCTATNPNAEAIGAMKGTTTATFSGTATQLAVFALGQITDVQALGQSTRAPTLLSFANSSATATVLPSSRLFGGGFGSVVCANNYIAEIPTSTVWNTSTSDINISTLASGKYYYKGNVNLFGLLPDDAIEGRRVVVYVDGDVSVRADAADSGRVGYANNLQWANTDLIPSLYVISKGNIYVDYGVSELDGVYVAQPINDGSKGEIFSCYIGTSYPTIPQRTEECRTALRVNGAFMARQVHLLRTLGSLRESYPGEGPLPDPTPNDPAPTIPASTRAAETFIYNPALWFTKGGGLPPNKKIQIDSYTSLPPSL